MAGGVINTGLHPALLWPGVHSIWGQTYAEHNEEYVDLFEQRDSTMAFEKLVQVTGFGLAPVKPEGQSGSYDTEFQGQITNFVHIPYSLGYIVTKEEIDDNQYKQVAENRARANAFSMAQTIENAAAFIYNNAFVSTYYTTGDGQPLCSTAHTNVVGGTWSNKLSPDADLSEAAIENLGIQIMLTQNDRGMQIALQMQSLHIAPAQWYNANRILKSVLQSNTSTNNLNVLKATNALPGGIKMNHYFNQPNAWFVRTNAQDGMVMFWRARPDLQMDNDFDTKNAKALSYMRFSMGAGDPRGIFGSNGP